MKKYDLRTHIKIARIILWEDAIQKAAFKIFAAALAFMPFAMCIAYFIPEGRILYEKFPYSRFKDFMFVAIPYLIGFIVVICFCFTVLSIILSAYMSSLLKKIFSPEAVSEIMISYDFRDVENYHEKMFGYKKLKNSFMNTASQIEWKKRIKKEKEEREVNQYFEENGISHLDLEKGEKNDRI